MSDKEKKTKNIGVLTILGWVFGLFFMLGGVGTLPSSMSGAIMYILAGSVIFPPLNKIFTEKTNIKLSRTLRVVISLILIIVGGFTLSSSESITESIDKSVEIKSNNNVQSTPQVMTTPEPLKEVEKTPTCTDECTFIGYQCSDKDIISCKQVGDCKVKKVEKTCANACTTGHCVHNIGDTITKNSVDVTLVSAEDLYIPAEFAGSGEYRFVVSESQELFKVRIKVTNNDNQERHFSDPSYSMVVLDDLGNQYEPTFFYGNDNNQKEFGSGTIYPKVTKIGDVYFEKLDEKATELRVIIKDGFFTIYTNDEDKGLFEDESFEWVKKLE